MTSNGPVEVVNRRWSWESTRDWAVSEFRKRLRDDNDAEVSGVGAKGGRGGTGMWWFHWSSIHIEYSIIDTPMNPWRKFRSLSMKANEMWQQLRCIFWLKFLFPSFETLALGFDDYCEDWKLKIEIAVYFFFLSRLGGFFRFGRLCCVACEILYFFYYFFSSTLFDATCIVFTLYACEEETVLRRHVKFF